MLLIIVLPLLTYFLTAYKYRKYVTSYEFIPDIIINMAFQTLLICGIKIFDVNESNIIDCIIDLPKIIVAIIVHDFIFGSIHLFVHKYMWAEHSIHHSLNKEELNGLFAQYAGVADHLLSNVLPVFLAGEVVNLSYYGTILWYMFAEYNSVYSHIDFPEIKYKYHIIHHTKINKNYGSSVGLFDALMNTLYTKNDLRIDTEKEKL